MILFCRQWVYCAQVWGAYPTLFSACNWAVQWPPATGDDNDGHHQPKVHCIWLNLHIRNGQRITGGECSFPGSFCAHFLSHHATHILPHPLAGCTPSLVNYFHVHFRWPFAQKFYLFHCTCSCPHFSCIHINGPGPLGSAPHIQCSAVAFC